MVARVRLGVFVASVALYGCYDMERLDVGTESGRLWIDDFDDGDDFPSVPSFGRWKAYPFKPGSGSSSHTDSEEVVGGGFALFGEFVFTDPGGGDFTGASLGIADARETLDVRRYGALHVSTRFDPGSRQLPVNTRYYAELSCNSVVPIPGQPSPYYVQHAVTVTRDWQAFRLDLDRFVEPSPEEPRIAGGPSACLAVVDAIRFTVSMSLGTGVEGGGKLSIDDVYFE